jgi:rubrerythrin
MPIFLYRCLSCGEEWEDENPSMLVAEQCPFCDELAIAEEEVEES